MRRIGEKAAGALKRGDQLLGGGGNPLTVTRVRATRGGEVKVTTRAGRRLPRTTTSSATGGFVTVEPETGS